MTTDDRIRKIHRAVVYELVDQKSGKRYIGQTRKHLQTRRNQHLAEARSYRSSRPIHEFLRTVIKEGREDDVEIHPLPFDSEAAAIEEQGLNSPSLLNRRIGKRQPPNLAHRWTPDQVDVLEDHTVAEAVDILGLNRNIVLDAARQINANRGRSGRMLSPDQVLEMWTRYHLHDDLTYSDLAGEYGVSLTTVGQIIRRETYTDVDVPSKAAIEAHAALSDDR